MINQFAKRRENILVYMWFKFFLNCLSAQIVNIKCFCLYRMFDFRENRNDVFKCMKKSVICIMWKTFSSKIFETRIEKYNLMFWIIDDLWCLMTQYWLIWFNCYCFCNWNDQKYVERCFIFDLMFRSLDDLNLID